jgi:hypothetical protein
MVKICRLVRDDKERLGQMGPQATSTVHCCICRGFLGRLLIPQGKTASRILSGSVQPVSS